MDTQTALERIRVGTLKSFATLGAKLGKQFEATHAFGPHTEKLAAGEFPPYVPIQSGFQLVGQHLVRHKTEWSAGLNHYIWHGPCDNVRVSHSILEGGAKWASRSYRMRSLNVVEFSAFLDTYPEHDLYWNIAGYNGDASFRGRFAALFRGLYFERTGGQNIQLVQMGDNRRYEEGFGAVEAGDWSHGGPIVVVDCLSRDAGWLQDGPHVRSAYAFSFFESDNDVYLTRVFIDKTMQPKSQGCLLIQGHKKAVVRSSAFLAHDTKQPLVKVSNVEECLFEGCVIEADAGQNWVEIEGPSKVTFRKCVGSARINANRTTIGEVSKDATYQIPG
jgi:hypothetical protein